MQTTVLSCQVISSKLLFAKSPECDLTCHARMGLMVLVEDISLVYNFELQHTVNLLGLNPVL